MNYPKLSGKFTEEDYLKLSEFAKNYDHSQFFNEIKDKFNWIFDKDDMDYIALYLQICIKTSRPLYLHGYVISSALYDYIKKNPEIENLTILETGTARGFADVVMAKVLKENNVKGKIHTIDWTDKISNCILKPGNVTIPTHEVLEKWSEYRDNYINFLKGDSKSILKKLDIGRIHFAFLDGAHKYDDLMRELNFVESNQESGDIIICDDYTINQFPEICKAVDTFLRTDKYEHQIFFGKDGVKERGYVYMKRK
jgi:hypothetical protein